QREVFAQKPRHTTKCRTHRGRSFAQEKRSGRGSFRKLRMTVIRLVVSNIRSAAPNCSRRDFALLRFPSIATGLIDRNADWPRFLYAHQRERAAEQGHVL